MQKNEIDDKLVNNFSNSSRLITICNTHKVTTSYYIESHKYHTQIAKNRFLDVNTQFRPDSMNRINCK